MGKLDIYDESSNAFRTIECSECGRPFNNVDEDDMICERCKTEGGYWRKRLLTKVEALALFPNKEDEINNLFNNSINQTDYKCYYYWKSGIPHLSSS